MKSEFRRLMEEDRIAARQLLLRLLRKHNTKEICVLIGVKSTRALYLIKKDLGVLREKFAPTQHELDTMTPREIAKEYDISLQRVYGYLREKRNELGSGNEKNLVGDNQTSESGSRETVPNEHTCGVPKG